MIYPATKEESAFAEKIFCKRSTPDSLFMYDDTFMQVAKYVQKDAQIKEVEDMARKFVVDYIFNEFEHHLLGMQDYTRWAVHFKHKCESVSAAFWAQVNMHNLMMAHELEMDTNMYKRANTGNTKRVGGQTTIADQEGSSNTAGKTTTS